MNAAVHNAPDKPVEPSGLPADDVDTLFSGLNSFSKLSLAVSGGADSLCLMVLFAEWKERAHWPGQAEVIVVDHGLRSESADEALFVVEKAEGAGLSAKVFRWDGQKPTGNVQEAARQARYRLIADRLSETGAEALILGHHLDDQAETFLDRLSRGSGLYGLSAMAADEADGPEGLRLLRPFLSIPKTRLEASLRDRGLTWCNDPSNQDAKYKRSRLRSIMKLLEAEGLTAEKIAQTASELRRSREALDRTVQDIAIRELTDHSAGPVKLRRQGYCDLAEDLRLRLLTLILERVTGARAHVRSQKLQAVDLAIRSEGRCRKTLAGALVEADKETIWCWREVGRTPPETLRDPVGEGTWDRRYSYSVPSRLRTDQKTVGLLLGPLCHAPIRSKDIEWPQGWPKEAFACSPVIWSEEGDIYPHSSSSDLRIGENDKEDMLYLARMPFRAKLKGNYEDDGDVDREI